MKIGFVLDDGLDKPDGVQQYILALGTWYSAHGHDVRYLVGQTSRADIDHVYAIPKNIQVRFNGNALSVPLPASPRRIKEVLSREQFDVLHVQVPYSPFFAAKVVRLAPPATAVVGTFHILPYGLPGRAGTHLLGAYLRRSLRRFDAHVSVSRPAAEFAASTFKIRSEIVPCTVPAANFKPVKKVVRTGFINILFLGRLVPRKGCRQLLEALALLKQSGKLPANVRADICGDGALRGELEDYARRNGLSKKVHFHGFVTHEQKIEYMQKADIAVFPSLSGESFGIVLIEAMAAGSGVVLGGDNPGYSSVLADVPGSTVNAHDPAVFADQLLGFVANPEKRARLHREQQRHVKQFDTPIVAKRLLKIYQACKTARIS